jgi:hypothetical protein
LALREDRPFLYLQNQADHTPRVWASTSSLRRKLSIHLLSANLRLQPHFKPRISLRSPLYHSHLWNLAKTTYDRHHHQSGLVPSGDERNSARQAILRPSRLIFAAIEHGAGPSYRRIRQESFAVNLTTTPLPGHQPTEIRISKRYRLPLRPLRLIRLIRLINLPSPRFVRPDPAHNGSNAEVSFQRRHQGHSEAGRCRSTSPLPDRLGLKSSLRQSPQLRRNRFP